jgi:hypothetical protein
VQRLEEEDRLDGRADGQPEVVAPLEVGQLVGQHRGQRARLQGHGPGGQADLARAEGDRAGQRGGDCQPHRTPRLQPIQRRPQRALGDRPAPEAAPQPQM